MFKRVVATDQIEEVSEEKGAGGREVAPEIDPSRARAQPHAAEPERDPHVQQLPVV